KEQLPEAAAFYQQAQEKAPDNGRALVELAAVRLQQHDAQPASELLSKALDSDVRNSLDAAEDARANMLRGRRLSARHDPVAAKDPSSAAYLFLQGKVADAIGKAEEAFRRYEAALQKKPDLVEALAAEGMVWVSRGDKARARERLDSALKNAAANSAIEDE